jgi:hypothetical protein
MDESEFNKQKRPPDTRNLPLASIIITSYNYEKFLPRAIDSALRQTYLVKEIIVVDDGSTDDSRKIIAGYGDQIIPIFKKNGGLISATNAGFSASQGEIIFFLDADDIFSPHKVTEMVNYFLQVMPQNPEALIFHRVEMTTEEEIMLSIKPKRLRTLEGQEKTGLLERLTDPEAGYRYIQKWGFLPFIASPSSGLSLTRSLASKIFPLPEEMKRHQDVLLLYGSILLGTVYGTSQVLGSYVLQGDNVSLNSTGFQGNNDRIKIIENFLNDILQKMNKPRIISYYDSPQATDYYRYCGSTKGVLKLAYKIPARCFCWETIRFSIKTLWLCLKIVLGIKKGPRLTKKAKLFAKAKKKLARQHSRRQTSVLKGEGKD